MRTQARNSHSLRHIFPTPVSTGPHGLRKSPRLFIPQHSPASGPPRPLPPARDGSIHNITNPTPAPTTRATTSLLCLAPCDPLCLDPRLPSYHRDFSASSRLHPSQFSTQQLYMCLSVTSATTLRPSCSPDGSIVPHCDVFLYPGTGSWDQAQISQ